LGYCKILQKENINGASDRLVDIKIIPYIIKSSKNIVKICPLFDLKHSSRRASKYARILQLSDQTIAWIDCNWNEW